MSMEHVDWTKCNEAWLASLLIKGVWILNPKTCILWPLPQLPCEQSVCVHMSTRVCLTPVESAPLPSSLVNRWGLQSLAYLCYWGILEQQSRSLMHCVCVRESNGDGPGLWWAGLKMPRVTTTTRKNGVSWLPYPAQCMFSSCQTQCTVCIYSLSMNIHYFHRAILWVWPFYRTHAYYRRMWVRLFHLCLGHLWYSSC